MDRRIVSVLLFVGCIVITASTTLAAPRKPRPSPAASPAAETVSSASAHLRLWKASDSPEGATMEIRLVPVNGSGEKGVTILSTAERYQFASYDNVPTGPATVEITFPTNAPVKLGVHLVKDQDYTLLVRVRRGVPTAELLCDTPPAGDDGAVFNVFNLVLDEKGAIQVNLGDALSAHLNALSGTIRAQGIKPAFYQITVNGTDSDGQALHWNTETDLRKVRRATLIVCPDSYGRIRPRLIEDSL